MAFLELDKISKRFGTRVVLDNVSLSVEKGEFVSVVGVSAAGKTTLLKIASGLMAPDSGSVAMGGARVTAFPKSASMVFQNYSLLPWLSSLENVRLAVEGAYPEWAEAKQIEQAEKYLRLVGLGAAFAKKPSQLSGGMRQRVAIARAFATEPEVLYLDEPFGALDALTRSTLQQELGKLVASRGKETTVLMITNSVDEARLLSDRVFTLNRAPEASLTPGIPDAVRPWQRVGGTYAPAAS